MAFIYTYILFTHFIGDFVCQTDNMALNKSKSIKWLTIHVLTYLAVLTTAMLLILDPVVALKLALINGVIHWITDFFTSKMNAKLYQRESKRYFYIGVGFDQFLHGGTLILTYYYVVELTLL